MPTQICCSWKIVPVFVTLAFWCVLAAVAGVQSIGDFVIVFGGERLVSNNRSTHILYELNPGTERFFIHVPASYSPHAVYGLIVFTDAAEEIDRVPDGWATVLDQRKFLFIAAENEATTKTPTGV